MLKYRLLVGIPMAFLAAALLTARTGPEVYGLLVMVITVGLLASNELRSLLPAATRPRPILLDVGVVMILAANWVGLSTGEYVRPAGFAGTLPSLQSWLPVVLTAGAASAAALAHELLVAADSSRLRITRLWSTVFALTYLGVLPSFLLQLRGLVWSHFEWAVLATVFVPKVGDIGAYFTGRLIGRRPLAPTISPKKTWEGFWGGMVAAAGTAVGVWGSHPHVFPLGWPEAALFGLVVGGAGVLGDLFESWLKRRAQVKDASASLPGFGGVLDVIDSVLFAAPVAYLWFALGR